MTFSASGQIGASKGLFVDRSHNMLHPQNLIQIVFGENVSEDVCACGF